MPASDLFVPSLIESSLEEYNEQKLKDPKTILLRASTLSSCPKQAVLISNGETYSEQTQQFFIRGKRLHYFREKLTNVGIPLHKEEDFYICTPDKKIFFKGKMDLISLDDRGVFLLDYKTTGPGSFFFKIKEGIQNNNFTQLCIYKYLFYVITGVEIIEGGIQYVDEDNSRHFLQITVTLASLSECQSFLLTHPVLRYLKKELTEDQLYEEAKKYIDQFPYFCNYCGFAKCRMNPKCGAQTLTKVIKDVTKNDKPKRAYEDEV
jgi:hypothetical protein